MQCKDGANGSACGVGGTAALSQRRVLELSKTLEQLQTKLNVQHARSSPRVSPRKGSTGESSGPSNRPSSHMLRDAEQQLQELTARLEKAQSRSK